MGYIGWLGTFEGNDDPEVVHEVDSQIVSELLTLGAILYCKVCLIWDSLKMADLLTGNRRAFRKHYW